MLTDFRSWLSYSAEQDHWLGAIAKDIRNTGWPGLQPHELREWLEEKGFPASLQREVDQLERFYSLYRARELRRNGG